MPDDNRFQNIGDALEGDDETDDEPTDDSEPVQETQPEPTTEPEHTDEEDAEPAFAYEATVQKSVYVLPDAWNDLDGAMSLAEAKLKTEDGETDVTTSELHTALAKLGAENPDELRRLVREAREK